MNQQGKSKLNVCVHQESFMMRLGICLALLFSQITLQSAEAQFGQSPLGASQFPNGNRVITKFGFNEDLERSLNSSVSIEAKNQTLEQIIRTLMTDTGVKFTVNRFAVEDLGLTGNEKFSISIKNQKLKTALTRILAPSELTYVVTSNSIEITSQADADTLMVTRVYDVSDLLAKKIDSSIVMTKASQTDFNELGDLLVKHIAPATWIEEGGNGTFSSVRISDKATLLVVTQFERNHTLIEEMFKKMRQKLKEQTAINEKPEDDQVTVRVYRIIPEKMSMKDCISLLQTVFDKVEWGKDANSIKVMGDAIVMKQRNSVHVKVFNLFNDLGLLKPANEK